MQLYNVHIHYTMYIRNMPISIILVQCVCVLYHIWVHYMTYLSKYSNLAGNGANLKVMIQDIACRFPSLCHLYYHNKEWACLKYKASVTLQWLTFIPYHTHTLTHMYMCTCTTIHTHMYIHTLYTHTHTHTHTRTRTHTHTLN